MFSFPKIQNVFLATTVTLASLNMVARQAEALMFNFDLDNTPDTQVTAPIIATGLFEFDGDPGNGVFSLSSLPNYDFFFDFDGDIFTNDDFVGNAASVNVVIAGTPSNRSVTFAGPLDFLNNANLTETSLAFDPTGANLYTTTNFNGNYQGTELVCPCIDIPEPSFLVGLFSFGVAGLFRKRFLGNYS